MNDPLGIMPVYMRSSEELAVTRRTIDTWRTSGGPGLLLVDDCSPDAESIEKLADYVAGIPDVDLVTKPENEGFASTVNVGLMEAVAQKRDAILVNADMEFLWDDWLEALSGTEGDVIGARLIYPNGLIQHAGIFYSVLTSTYDHIYKGAPANLPAAQYPRTCPVTGALQYIRYDTLVDVGIYDDEFRLSFEDVDYCLRVFYSGRKCVYQPAATVVHHESLFRGNKSKRIAQWERESFKRLLEKHANKSLQFMPLMIGEMPPA